uniref:Uncharacterized protein n=1 Tax=Rousettus aegyptiacus TaxID=9407 RepID=A0A7J8DXD2_ROUAE|nr:hypothetical protein HJG63_008370 [Rousettus aegyptiacus]
MSVEDYRNIILSPVSPELKTVNNVSLDWFMGQLYWASSFARYLYWVNRGQKGMRTIETAGMDGSDRKMLAVINMEEPVGLTFDYVTGRLYWTSKYKERVLYWVESRKHLQSMTLDGKNRQEVWRGTWTADIHMALDLGSSSILWTTKGLGLQSLSLLKNRTYTLNKTWSDGFIVAHEPYLVTVNGAALVLWNRRMLEPFSVSKEPHVRKMIILAENQEGPDPKVEGAATSAHLTHPPPLPLLCTQSSVLCQNGKECIPKEYLCDGGRDCQDGSDEENCSQLRSRSDVFQCLDRSKCIEEKYHCVGAQQCLNGFDEVDCWKPTVLCAVTTRPAVSLRAGYVMATQTVLTKKMNKDVFMKNAAHLNLDVRMANAYLILCIVMGTETAWTTQMKTAVLLPGPCGAHRGR